MSLYILDSYALLAFFQDEAGGPKVQNLIHKAQQKKCVLKLSVINWGELYYTTVRSKGKVAGEQILIVLGQCPIEVIGVDSQMVYQAAVFKSKYALSYEDCFAAALAQKEQAPLVTGDPEFKILEKEIKVFWIS